MKNSRRSKTPARKIEGACTRALDGLKASPGALPARDLFEKAAEMGLLPATYVQATPDLMMGELLKHMRASQIRGNELPS